MTKMLCSSYAGGKGTRWSFTQGESLLLNSGTKMSMICTKIYWGVIDFTNDFFFFWPHHRVCGILVTQTGTEPTFPTVESQPLDP